MDYLLGALMTVVFFILCGGSFYLGYRMKQPKAKPPDMDAEEKRRIERYNKHFKELFSYDVDTALKRKKVHE